MHSLAWDVTAASITEYCHDRGLPLIHGTHHHVLSDCGRTAMQRLMLLATHMQAGVTLKGP
jgi:hypothetical protein